MARLDSVLLQFRDALSALYGDRIERVVLFGSRARGEARSDSDYDVAVFLKALDDRWGEADRIATLPRKSWTKPARSFMQCLTLPEPIGIARH